jgi:hypothetical protein
MIIDKHPELSFGFFDMPIKFVGYWKYKDDRYHEATRHEHEIKLNADYASADSYLPSPLDFIDNGWDDSEKKVVAQWLVKSTRGVPHTKYLCGTLCRICGIFLDHYGYLNSNPSGLIHNIPFPRNFNTEPPDYLFEGMAGINGLVGDADGIIVFPASFIHYVLAHNVKPPQCIIDAALRYAAKLPKKEN